MTDSSEKSRKTNIVISLWDSNLFHFDEQSCTLFKIYLMILSTKFYQDVFGWQITKFPEMDYYLATTTPSDENMKPKEPGAINGGLLKKDPTGEHPVIVIDVPSLDEHISKVESAGGKTVIPKNTSWRFWFVC